MPRVFTCLVIALAAGCATADVPTLRRQTTPWHQLSADTYTFEQYLLEFQKTYTDPKEYAARKATFQDKLDQVLRHNADDTQSYKKGVNHFSDRTEVELQRMRGLKSSLLYASNANKAPTLKRQVYNMSALPASVDYRTKGILTPVKNQGECGSCWAFASTETLEAHWALKTGNLWELSEQFVLDCTPNPDHCGGTGGCGGGTGELYYASVKKNGGIPGAYTYPYLSGLGAAGKCHGTPLPPASPHHGGPMAVATVNGYTNTVSNNYESMMTTLATVGPMAISVDAGAWHDYESGVFDRGNHTNPDLDHLVQLIGYGTDEVSGKDYWLVRNSWTPLWGERGFIRLQRNGAKGQEPCGKDITPADGNGCTGGPSVVEVCGQNGMLYDGIYPNV